MRLLALLCCGFLVGCSNFFLGTSNLPKPAPLPKIATQALKIKPLWQYALGDLGVPSGAALQIARDGQRVFAINRKGVLSVLNAQSGALMKRFELGKTIDAGLVLGQDVLYAVTSSGEMLAIDPDNGALHWQTALGGRVLSRPVRAGNLLVARTIGGEVLGLNVENGDVVWRYALPVAGLSMRDDAAVLIAPSVVVVIASGQITLLNPQTGLPTAVRDFPLSSKMLAGVNATPLTAGPVILVSGLRSGSFAINMQDGNVLWARPDLHSAYNGALTPEAWFLESPEGWLYAINPQTGATLWENKETQGRGASALLALPGILAHLDHQGWLFWHDAQSGKLIAEYPLAVRGSQVTPLALPQSLFWLTADGVVHAFTVEQP